MTLKSENDKLKTKKPIVNHTRRFSSVSTTSSSSLEPVSFDDDAGEIQLIDIFVVFAID
jgi:hypothetical protein